MPLSHIGNSDFCLHIEINVDQINGSSQLMKVSIILSILASYKSEISSIKNVHYVCVCGHSQRKLINVSLAER